VAVAGGAGGGCALGSCGGGEGGASGTAAGAVAEGGVAEDAEFPIYVIYNSVILKEGKPRFPLQPLPLLIEEIKVPSRVAL